MRTEDGSGAGADRVGTGALRRSDQRILVALVLLAAVFRVGSALVLSSDLRIREPIIDGAYYLDLATQLARNGGWPAGPIFMTPLYPLLLSLVFRLVGPEVAAVQVLQSLLGLGTLVFLFLAVRRDLGLRAAVGAAALYILCGPILALESLVLTESLLLFLLAVALWAWPGRNRSAGAPMIFGMACGLLAIGRGTFLFLPVAWAGWMILGAGVIRVRAVRHPAVRSTAPVFAGVVGALLVVLLPLAVHQTRATGRPQVLALNGGLNLYLGNNPTTRGLYSMPAGIDLEKDRTGVRSASVLAGRSLTPLEADRFYAGRARAFFRDHPARALWLLGRKALLFLIPREIPQIENFEALRARAWPLRVAFIDFRWVLPLAALGIAAAWSRRAGPLPRGAGSDRSFLSSWVLLVAVGWLSTILFFATGRYRVPFLAGFLGPAGLGAADLAAVVLGVLSWGIRRGADRARNARLEAGAGESLARRVPLRLLLLPAIVGLQLLLPSYPVAEALACDATQLGVRESRRGNPEAALLSYREALGFDPLSGEAWDGAGAALAKLGRLGEAVEAYRQALRILPGSPVTHCDLGAVLGRLGNDAAALVEFREAVRLDPFEPAYHLNLAVALARTGDLSAAGAAFRSALKLDPSYAPAQRGLETLGVGP